MVGKKNPGGGGEPSSSTQRHPAMVLRNGKNITPRSGSSGSQAFAAPSDNAQRPTWDRQRSGEMPRGHSPNTSNTTTVNEPFYDAASSRSASPSLRGNDTGETVRVSDLFPASADNRIFEGAGAVGNSKSTSNAKGTINKGKALVNNKNSRPVKKREDGLALSRLKCQSLMERLQYAVEFCDASEAQLRSFQDEAHMIISAFEGAVDRVGGKGESELADFAHDLGIVFQQYTEKMHAQAHKARESRARYSDKFSSRNIQGKPSLEDRLKNMALESDDASSFGGYYEDGEPVRYGARDRGNHIRERPRGNNVPLDENPFGNFPVPWNVRLLPSWGCPPEKLGADLRSTLTGNVLPVFGGGTVAEYGLWRAQFLSNVHRQPCDVWSKVILLNKALHERVIAKLGVRVEFSAQGYEDMVRELESYFGGEERIINATLSAVRSLPPVRENHVADLETFIQAIKAYIAALNDAQQAAEAESRSFYMDIIFLLPYRYKIEFKNWAHTLGIRERTNTLIDWARDKLCTLKEVAIESRFGEGATRNDRPPKRANAFVAREEESCDCSGDDAEAAEESAFFVCYKSEDGKDRCVFCRARNQSTHTSLECREFPALTIRARRNFVVSLGLCYICGRSDHGQADCRAERCKKCQGRHHTNLHEDERSSEQQEETSGSSLQTYTGVATYNRGVALMTARVYIRNPVTQVSTVVNALLDTGNTSPFLSKRVAKALKLTGHRQDVTIAGISGLISKQKGALVSRLEVLDRNGKNLSTTTVRVIENPAGDLRAFDWSKVKDQFDILSDLNLQPPCGGGEVDLILGVDWPGLLSHSNERISADGRTAARLTPFGWVAYGSTSPIGGEEGEEVEASLMSFRAELASEFCWNPDMELAGESQQGPSSPTMDRRDPGDDPVNGGSSKSHGRGADFVGMMRGLGSSDTPRELKELPEPRRKVVPTVKESKLHPVRVGSSLRCVGTVAGIRRRLKRYQARKVEGQKLKGIQAATFLTGLDRLHRVEPVLMKSPLTPLAHAVDTGGVLRVGGHLKVSEKRSLGLRSPLLLGDDEVAKRWMLDQHCPHHRIGYNFTLDGLLEGLWCLGKILSRPVTGLISLVGRG